MSNSAYGTVVGGKLKLKGKAAPVRQTISATAKATTTAPRTDTATAKDRLVPEEHTGEEAVSGVKRKANPSDTAHKAGENSSDEGSAPSAKRVDRGGRSGSPMEGSSSVDAKPVIKAYADGLTPAQRAHAELLKRREKDIVKKMVEKSHREKVDALNQLLSVIPEHHDIPKISYAGIG